MTMKSLILTVVVAVVAFGGGYWFGSMGSEQAATVAYEEKVAEIAKSFPPIPATQSLIGIADAVEDSSVTFTADFAGNPMEQLVRTKKVSVLGTTKVVKTVIVDLATFTAEQRAYEKEVDRINAEHRAAILKGGEVPAPVYPSMPSQAKETEISLSDIQVGDRIEVTADHNIESETAFTAVKISLLAKASEIIQNAAPAAVPKL